MRRLTKRVEQPDAELDITAFMNLMIVLVPVLLMSMVFNHITVLELNLPDLTGGTTSDSGDNKQLEVVIREDDIQVFYPSQALIATVDKIQVPAEDEGAEPTISYDFDKLSTVMQAVKKQLIQSDPEKRDVLILSEPQIDYQAIISTMDTVRSYTSVVVTDVVEVELFPSISLGDAPEVVQ